MIGLVQRVSSCSVEIGGQLKSQIGKGLLIFVGIEEADAGEDATWLAGKIANLRIFNDSDGVMNLSVIEADGELLVVSQFTLHASTKKGNRPSYIRAARPEHAIPLYEEFIRLLSEQSKRQVQTGEFGADMKIALVNDGPVTIIIDTKDRK